MNDHRNHRRRGSEPAWPTGDEQPQERTGFWSPLWDDDDDDVPVGNRGRNGHRNGSHSNGHGGARNGGAPQWPTEQDSRSSGPHRAQPRPRPAPRSASAPAWPSQEPPPAGPPPRVPGRNGMAGGARPPGGPAPRIARPRPAGPPPISDGPTELLPPVSGARTGPEPELLTHREPDYDEDLRDDPDLAYDEEEAGPLTEVQRKKRRKKVWRRIRRTMYTFIALMIIGPMLAFFIAYQIVEVPKPEATGPQSVTLQYKDGTQMAKLVPPGGENRTMVSYDEIPKHVLQAVYAAEDAEFETNPGFDISGVMRAAWNQVSGGTGGASTITQQYIKQATGEDEQSLTRKGLEIVKAYKMNNTYTKEEIITAYLNTIYFGRSAYGIGAASQAYYGKPLKELTASQAALLAGMIQSPGRYKEVAYIHKRWNFVMDQMVDKGWMSAAARKAEKPPMLTNLTEARPKGITGPRAHIQRAVFDELEREAGLTEDEIYNGGYTIKTTIEPAVQTLAETSVTDVMAGEPTNLYPAMVAVDPKTGEVIAYYGGSNGVGLDWAKAKQEPGSSFKPFDLVALLQDGKGLGETYDGSNARKFGNITVNNSEGGSCGTECTVKEAMRKSINTVFYDMVLNDTGTQKVADAAEAAGITADLKGTNGGAPDGGIAIGGGNTQVSTLDMASAYATFAAQGTFRKPHLVLEVLGPEGGTVYKPKQEDIAGKAAFDPNNVENNKKIARNVTESLKPVLDYSNLKCAGGRECAGKTGTHQLGETEDNAKAWMVGYTPQVSTAVSMAAQDETGKQMPVKNVRGKNVYGSGLPGKIWQKFMDSYLKDKPKEGFGKFVPIGKDAPKKSSNPPKTTDQSTPPTQPTEPTTDPSEPTEPTEPTEEPTGPDPTIIPPFPNNNGRGNDPG